ncbi:PLDc N-terminal domain-containing protein [Schaalia naturae]|jgi:hypothetical protein|uniref:PLDc N-terminal domain-containing protein n=1 Tax=Schaalia naturae TaxID=635203 RepID=A0ABW2SIZ7_9ACTO
MTAAAVAGFSSVLLIILWIGTMINIVRTPAVDTRMKALWVAACAGSPLIGAVCWFVWGRRQSELTSAR